jgi:ABC-type amino acid transport system permease subunit
VFLYNRLYDNIYMYYLIFYHYIRVITKLPNSEQSYKGKVKPHKYINRQNQSTTGNCENRNDPDLVQAFLKKYQRT